ncbi:MAG TPA: serine/threonine-protein kinase [Rhodocyclaceae bacterium]|nr:serine/threonine-protein kinase [Rhodocyclaceae bacterium]
METIGRYEVKGKLGEGATSIVYLGFDPEHQREVAIKVIYPHVLKDRERGLMYRHLLMNEASLAGKMEHPSIVQIHEAVLDDDLSYIVMEYVRGGTLEQFCSAEALLPIETLVEVIFKCTRALQYAQRLGITHRDIKPANILLVQPGNISGDIKISDFGAAITPDNDQTQVSAVGSPAYMSPEQVRESPLNHQTDIYSLGVVMYQLLTGRLPFQASSNYNMVYQICNSTAPPPSTFRSDLRSSLDAVVQRAMQKDLSTRYQSWEEFSVDLAQAYRNRRLTERVHTPDIEKFETLRALQFFREFSDTEVWEAVRFSRWEEVSAGTLLMREGEPGDTFSILLDGEVRISKQGVLLDVLGPGDIFGEITTNTPTMLGRTADVTAQTDARVAIASRNALRHASEACRMHFYEAFLSLVSRRLAAVNNRVTGANT